MSNIRDVKERKELALKKYGEQPEDKSLLWADFELVEELEETINFMAGDQLIDGMLLPRFGVLSLILRTTPCYVYGHPAFKKMCRTAFTDGVNVFICDDFFEKLLKDVKESKGTEYGIEPLVLHELMHKMFNHVQRLKQFPKDLANKAADLSINTKLQTGFPELEWSKSLRETGLGFKPGDIEKYIPLSEESIARELLAEELKKQQQKNKKGQKDNKNKQGNSQGGQSQGGNQSGQSGQNPSQSSPQSSKGGSKGNQKGSQSNGGNQQGEQDKQQSSGKGNQGDEDLANDTFGDDGDDHMIDLKDLVETLEEAGLDEVKEALHLPDSDDVEEIGRVLEDNQDRQHEAIQQATAQANQSQGKYPGQHIVDAASEYVKGFSKGKLSWKLAVQQLVLGEGMKFQGSYENFADIAYVEEVEEDLQTPLYLPTEIPHKSEEAVLVLIDTSGSVSTNDIKAFLSEIFELKTASENMGDSASEVFVLSADTVMRGEPIEINDENVDELMENGVKMFGRGGTDLGHSLKQALELPLMKEKKIRSVVYFTDLFDTPPKFSSLGVKDNTSIVYVAAPSTHSAHQEEFAKAVESYARVVSIKEGQEVDLDDTKSMSVSPSKRM